MSEVMNVGVMNVGQSFWIPARPSLSQTLPQKPVLQMLSQKSCFRCFPQICCFKITNIQCHICTVTLQRLTAAFKCYSRSISSDISIYQDKSQFHFCTSDENIVLKICITIVQCEIKMIDTLKLQHCCHISYKWQKRRQAGDGLTKDIVASVQHFI